MNTKTGLLYDSHIDLKSAEHAEIDKNVTTPRQTVLTGNPQRAQFDTLDERDSDRDFFTANQSFATDGFVTAPNSDTEDKMYIQRTLKKLEFKEIEEYWAIFNEKIQKSFFFYFWTC